MKEKLGYFSKGEYMLWFGSLAVGITVVFYFILEGFDTANIIPSTISVTTSFLAVYLTFRRRQLFSA